MSWFSSRWPSASPPAAPSPPAQRAASALGSDRGAGCSPLSLRALSDEDSGDEPDADSWAGPATARTGDAVTFGINQYDEQALQQERQVSTDASNAEMRRTARLADHRAAVLIAGSAGMPNVNAVWVDCSPNRAWLDKLDERRLMKMAYDVADGRGEQVQRVNSAMRDMPNVAPAIGNARDVSHEVMTVLKQFRQELIRSHVVCLSPVAEAAMAELASELEPIVGWTPPAPQDSETGLDQWSTLTLAGVSVDPKTYAGAGGAEHHVATVHDRSFTKLLTRILRRHPNFSTVFCQAVGKLVAYRSALQHGSAVTRLRLVEMRADSIRERRKCLEWFRAPARRDGVQELAKRCHVQPWLYALSFDWVSVALRELDQDQKGAEAMNALDVQSGPVRGSSQRRARGQVVRGNTMSPYCYGSA